MITPLECARMQLDSWREENGYPTWKTVEGEKYDTQYFIKMKEDGEAVICFCPSNSKIDWKNNFYFFKKAYNDCDIKFYAHRGFLRCWKEVRHAIEGEIKTLNPTCITVTGWSYGGALAILCMEDMTYLYPLMKIQCVTFGAPRVIWGFFRWNKLKERWNSENRKTIQFKNGSDIVTAVPLMVMGFHHVGELTHIGQPIRWWRYFNPSKHHLIDNYESTMCRIGGEKSYIE